MRKLTKFFGVVVCWLLLSLASAWAQNAVDFRLSLSYDADGQVCDVLIDYTESYEHQMLRYSSEYGFLQ